MVGLWASVSAAVSNSNYTEMRSDEYWNEVNVFAATDWNVVSDTVVRS